MLHYDKRKKYLWCYCLACSPSAVDYGFPQVQTKTIKLVNCCFSTKHAALRRKSKDWLARNQDNVSKLGDMSIHGPLVQFTIKIQLSMLI